MTGRTSLTYAILTNPQINKIVRGVAAFVVLFVGARRFKRLPVVGDVSIKIDGIDPFIMRTDGKDSIATILHWSDAKDYEHSENLAFVRLLQFSKIVLDVGANSGLYSLIAASHPHPEKVVAFEPVPQIARYLRDNIRINNFEVEVVEVALSDAEGEFTLYVPEQVGLPTSASMNSSFRSNTKQVSIKAETLDSFMKRTNCPKIDLIKIDTESTEPSVLRGGAATITDCRPVILCEVLENRTEKDLDAFFQGRKYEYFKLIADCLECRDKISGDNNHPNYLFVPQEKVAMISTVFEVRSVK